MLLLVVATRRNDRFARLNVGQWCCLRFPSATDTRSTSPARLCPASAGTAYRPAHYESVDEGSSPSTAVPSRRLMPGQDRPDRYERRATATCVQPLVPDQNLNCSPQCTNALTVDRDRGFPKYVSCRIWHETFRRTSVLHRTRALCRQL